MLKDQYILDFSNPSFYNTIDAKGEVLVKYEADCKSQEEMVLEVFYKSNELAWFEVQGFLPDMNEVSLKRSLTNLKGKGKLFKTSTQVMGPSGKSCYKYKLI